MTDVELPLGLWILLGGNLFLLLLVALGQLRLSGRMKRVEYQLSQGGGAGRVEGNEASRSETEKEQYRIFHEFLDEDPSRNGLPKKEQFAEFRKWRKEKGLNWSA